MKRPFGLITAVGLVSLATMSASLLSPIHAEKAYRVSQVVAVGDSIQQTKAKLRAVKLLFGEGGFAFVAREDEANLYCVIDENHTYAAIFYSKSRQIVTRISLVFFPSKEVHGKYTESWLDAQSIGFEPDGSYRVHFSPPRKPRPAGKATVPQLPPSQ
jgi:hypothetical protein